MIHHLPRKWVISKWMAIENMVAMGNKPDIYCETHLQLLLTYPIHRLFLLILKSKVCLNNPLLPHNNQQKMIVNLMSKSKKSKPP
jgi:hypothetical protein